MPEKLNPERAELVEHIRQCVEEARDVVGVDAQDLSGIAFHLTSAAKIADGTYHHDRAVWNP